MAPSAVFTAVSRILNGKPKWPHYGVDIAAPTGTEVHAPAGGIVTLALRDMFYSGGTLIVDHDHGLSSAFLHLSKLRVKTGDKVKQGDELLRLEPQAGQPVHIWTGV